jgi:flagellar FliL protein
VSASSASDDAGAAPKPKGKKKLILILAVVLLLVLGGGGAFFFLKRGSAEGEEDGAAQAAADSKTPPTFLPLDNMIVNLADPGGEKFAQIGITLQVEDAKAADRIKAFMPTIRSGILVLVSQRSSAELLGREGKEQLAADILAEVHRPLGIAPAGKPAAKKKAKPADGEAEVDEEEPKPKKAAAAAQGPVRKVLFSSFIVQ